MHEAAMTRWTLSPSFPERALRAAASGWFIVAALGHWTFVAYVVAHYGPLLLRGGPPALSESHLPNGFVAGDTLGNAAVIAHLLLAVIVIGGGPLQLIPQIRSRWPTFHRRLGRTYVAAAMTSAFAGIYMVWTRGTVGDTLSHVAITLDGVLILAFAVLAARYAMARDFARHRRWALRLFVVASGVWFYRIGFSAWLAATGGAGIDFDTFTGPFVSFISFGQYLVPLTVLELYYIARDRGDAVGRLAMACLLLMLTALTGAGTVAATFIMWLPRL